MQSEAKEEQPYSMSESKSRFNPDESPIFHVLNEHYDLHNLKSKCPTLVGRKFCKNKDRSALIFQQQCDTVEFPIFQGFNRNRQHLTTDRFLVDPETHRKLDPCHASVYYLNEMTQQVICVHVYYNTLGNLSHTPIQAKLEESNGSVTPLILTKIQKEYILQQTKPTQQLLLVLLQEKAHIQDVLLNTVKQLEEQLSALYGKPESQPILEQLSDIMHRSIRYSGMWDARLDFYELYLDKLQNISESDSHTSCPVSTKEDPSQEEDPSQVVSRHKSSRTKKRSVSKKLVPQKTRLIIEKIRKFIDEWLAAADPCDNLDDAQCIAWIIQYHKYFMRLETLYLFSRPTLTDDAFIQTQWQRLPTRGPLFEYFETQLFQGHSEIVRVLAPLMPEKNALVDLYERFLQEIEGNEVLRNERIETAHILYECSPTYLQVLTAKKYKLKTMNLSNAHTMYIGILFDLFFHNKYDVFCMYVDQGLADTTNIQLHNGNVPSNILGAIISFAASKYQSPQYLEKIISSGDRVIWPHIPEVDLGLYNIDGNKLHNENGEYTCISKDRYIRIVPQDMNKHYEKTILRYALDLYVSCVSINCAPIPYPAVIAQLIPYGDISCEQLIKETMRFFDNSFVLTSFILSNNQDTLSQNQGIYSNIKLFTDLSECSEFTQTIPDAERGSIAMFFALCLDRPDQRHLKDITSNIARQLLNACLDAFNGCSPKEQNVIVYNLFQLTVLALRKRDYHECISLIRALFFCCISTTSPSLEVHEFFIKSSALYVTTYRALFPPQLQHTDFIYLIKSLPSAYLNGLSAEVVTQLRVRNPALIDKIKRSASEAVTEVHDSVVREGARGVSPSLSEGPNIWKEQEQLLRVEEPMPLCGENKKNGVRPT